ncbi:MAG: VOC family protein [Humibacillus sp.]|nr:VOC family protein [Humibacillus sp.]MDN5779156.1 VOC family protein [Humibacillus sp.]
MSLDCSDPGALAAFYLELFGGELLWEKADSTGVRLPGLTLVAQRVEPYVSPAWPGSSLVHLDLSADSDLAEPSARAVSLGAVEVDPQPDFRWRVLLHPAGHAFCITSISAD